MTAVISSVAGSDLSQNNPGTTANISAIKMLLKQSEQEQMTNPVPEWESGCDANMDYRRT